MKRKYFEKLNYKGELRIGIVGSESQKKRFSLFFKLGNIYFCIIMEINRERRIEDSAEEKGEKEGKENINNFI